MTKQTQNRVVYGVLGKKCKQPHFFEFVFTPTGAQLKEVNIETAKNISALHINEATNLTIGSKWKNIENLTTKEQTK